MKRERYLTILLIICFSSYFMMCTMDMTVEAEDIVAVSCTSTRTIKRDSVVNNLKDLYLKEQVLNGYVSSLTKLSYDECKLIIQESKNNHLDLFIFLGVLKKESDFDPNAVGISGERGLGQLMENTAKPVAQNLGYIYDSEKLFNPRYNLKLTITQLAYLYDIYNKDINKTLTAYNRGQQGLIDYMNERKSPYKDPAMSEYSLKVLKFAYQYKEEFENFIK